MDFESDFHVDNNKSTYLTHCFECASSFENLNFRFNFLSIKTAQTGYSEYLLMDHYVFLPFPVLVEFTSLNY